MIKQFARYQKSASVYQGRSFDGKEYSNFFIYFKDRVNRICWCYGPFWGATTLGMMNLSKK